jgi:hypothetical protein
MFPGSPGAGTAAPEREEVVVSGTVEGIEIKPNGRFVVNVKQNPDDQYAMKLHTKDNDLAQFLMGQIGQAYNFRCGLSHYNLPDGKPVTSKWINEYAPAGGNVAPPPQPALTAEAPAWTQEHTQPAAPRGPREDKDLKITWLALAKGLPVECFKRLPTDQQTLDNAVKIADYWARVAMHRSQHGIPEWEAPVLDAEDVYVPEPGQTGLVDDIPF